MAGNNNEVGGRHAVNKVVGGNGESVGMGCFPGQTDYI